MPQTITNNAKLQCNQGTLKTPLTVTSQTFDCINGEPIATEQDNKPNINIKPFGQCKLKPSSAGYLPCVPAPQKWEKISFSSIDSNKELNESSCIKCAVGGLITFADKGKNDFISSEME
ncbi:DUF4280 domain-containing protein [Capnocytophaga catalasegens]|uniref:DUF4280 domain-containing protein n=1 Tax=Capnocytophaga catalasegens TaxID=1004260 RepID=A0AAV5AZU5_9FLAO|nr:DUF4280 domain-containing protein [Capnocytophaga catalasegens]GIZ16201.1 hypothetical protein RCZ03_22010 [Capnocytophaga catalasegens]GJM51620.1 hypothetical protein RCZ15_25930 [Capnocytophaga catalasegens]GJM54268.1 hypothetical protein RCZ16_25840 [Capnocytophaga catalasegens]